MAENRLSIGDIALPEPQNEYERNLKISLEQFIQEVRDNIDYLLKPRIITVTEAYTITDLDHTILCDSTGGGFTVNLPDATVNEGLVLNIIKIDPSNTITIDGNGSQTIDGSTTHSLNTQYDGVSIQSNGTNWFILADV